MRLLSLLILGSMFCLMSCGNPWQRALKKSPLSKEHEGFLVQAIDDKAVVFAHHAEQFFMPASTTKLFTYWAAQHFLPKQVPSFYYVERPDAMRIWASGDPSFLNPKFPDQAAFALLKNKKKSIQLAHSPRAKALGMGWAWDDYVDAYSAEASDFPIYGNLSHWSVGSGKWQVLPKNFLKDTVQQLGILRIQRPWERNQFVLPQSPAPGFNQRVPFKTSNALSAQLLSDTLGLSVTWSPQDRPSEALAGPGPVLDSLIKPMLFQSDNLIAEQLIYTIGFERQWAGDASEIIAQIQAQTPWLKGIRWVDGSGLSRYNLARPSDLVAVLQQIHAELPEQQWQSLLPLLGQQGTVSGLKLSHPDVRIWAKSGSFSNTYNLSGLVQTPKGKRFAFAFMCNLSQRKPAEIRALLMPLLQVFETL